MKEMDLKQIIGDFLASFKTVNVEVELTDDFNYHPEWTGNEHICDDVMYRTCPIKVDGFNSIGKYGIHLKSMEDLFLSQFREWKRDKDTKQIHDCINDVIHLMNEVFSLFRIKKSSEIEVFNNDGAQYLTNDIYVHEGVITTSIGEEMHPEKDYVMDYIPILSYYIKIQYETLFHVKNYITGYNEMMFKIELPKIYDSFTLNKKIKFNITKATDLKDYLERKEMIIEGNAYDFYRLFKNQKLDKKIQWIEGPGHLKHFIKILKKRQIIETKSMFEIAIKCFEFTGDKYYREITIDAIKHGHLPEKPILDSSIIVKNFF